MLPNYVYTTRVWHWYFANSKNIILNQYNYLKTVEIYNYFLFSIKTVNYF